MVNGIIGKKVGMTQLFLEDGTVAPATVLQAGPCVVVQQKTAQKDGYEAVQIGLVESKPIRANKAIAGHFKKANVPPTREVREVRVQKGADVAQGRRPGALLDLQPGRARRRDRHEQGQGLPGHRQAPSLRRRRQESHGSMFHRAPGSIGASSYPSRVFLGMRMHGHMGDERVTVRNLKVLRVDAENNLIVVRGNVPGANGGYVLIRKAIAAKPEPQPQKQEKPKKGKK